MRPVAHLVFAAHGINSGTAHHLSVHNGQQLQLVVTFLQLSQKCLLPHKIKGIFVGVAQQVVRFPVGLLENLQHLPGIRYSCVSQGTFPAVF